MKSNYKTKFDISTVFFLIFSLPIIIWPLSFNSFFSAFEKLVLTVIMIVIFLGINYLISDNHHLPKLKPYHKKILPMPDLNFSILSILSPQIAITCILGITGGGIIGFIYLYQDLMSFLSVGFWFFTVVLGMEFLFQDLYMKPRKLKGNNVVSFVLNKLNFFPLITPYVSEIVWGCIGGILLYVYYQSTVIYFVAGFILFNLVLYTVKSIKIK